MNLSAQEDPTFNEGTLILLNEEQLQQLTIICTGVCRCVFACFCQILVFQVAMSPIPTAAPWTQNCASHPPNT